MKKALLSVLAAGVFAATATPALAADDFTAINKAVAYVDGHASDIKAEVEKLSEVQKALGTKDYETVYKQAYNDVRNKYIKEFEAKFKQAQNIENHPNIVDPSTGKEITRPVKTADNKDTKKPAQTGKKAPAKKALPKTSAAK